ncbi:MAG TPA: hypothetical protein VGH63_13270 [Polyangia bacterium]
MAFNAAYRSLKSELIAMRILPAQVFQREVPNGLEALSWRDPAPELAVEGAVVVVQPDDT